MYCKKCGKKLANKAKFCSSCGTNAFEEIDDQNVSSIKDKPTVGMTVLSFIFPFIGAIYYLVKRGEKPKKSEACIYAAIFGVIADILFNYMF